ncbi:IclR family transcriptional regulator [Geomicrobium sp. JSM 1781026]|uniref:IclR family transcriptional regulator n=1 Tax=Geomicrobium sp. JSM 1781026 TaxID=3344580 RepID=UPI0035C1768C
MERKKKELSKAETIQSLKVGLSIVDVISKKNRPLKYNEILNETALSKNNLYKYLNTLTMLGILYRDEYSLKYFLGPKLAEYGYQTMNQENILEHIAPHLREINDYANETLLYTVATERGPIVVKLLSGSHTLNIGAQIGTLLPLKSACGKLYYAYENEQAEEWVDNEFKQLSKEDQNMLEEQKLQVIQQRITFANEPIAPGVSSLAVPILDFRTQLLGTVIMVGFKDRIPSSLDDHLAEYLQRKGREMSEILGGDTD